VRRQLVSIRAAVITALATCWLLTAACGAIADPKAKPRVPPGRDPGGTAVAIIGAGLDYTRPEIAQRLARDGEGHLTSWDFADNDRLPFAAQPEHDLPLAHIVLGEGQAARLVVVRVPARSEAALPGALQRAAATPARVVLMVAEVAAAIAHANLMEAARRMPHLLLVVPASRVAPGKPAASADSPRPHGLIVVGAGFEAAGSAADITAGLETRAGSPADLAKAAGTAPDEIAAARVAALAARIIAVAPEADGAALRARILGLAVFGRPGEPPALARIDRLFWLE
jgi:hypothetical protein